MLTSLLRRKSRRWLAMLLLGAAGMSSLSGCSRQFWRRQADRDSYNAIGEKLNDPHWQVPRIDLTPDPRSRFFDPYDPDKQPLPPDDPAAHDSMHCVNGRKGYKNWHKLGTAFAIENPQWLKPYGIEMQGVDPVLGHSKVQVKVNIPQAMDLATIHSREYQTNIEDVYLDALALTAERFKLGVRYLGINGSEPTGAFNTRTNSNGRATSVLGSTFGVSQALPTGGQVAVDIANSVTWVFAGNGSEVSAPTLGYSVTQPLLFRAGRKIALEPLTQAERDVLYSARTLARFRQTLFVQVTTAYLSLMNQKQGILNTLNNIRQVEEQLEAQQVKDTRIPGVVNAALEGFAGLQIPDNLSQLSYDGNWLRWRGDLTLEQENQILALSDDLDYKAAAQELIDFKKQQTTSLSFLQLRDRLNRSQLTLANSRRQLADQQDTFKILLGLPPNVSLDVDESILKPFELISWDLINLEGDLRKVQKELGERLLPDQANADVVTGPSIEAVREYIAALSEMRDRLYVVGIEQVKNDFQPLREVLELTKDDWAAAKPGLRYFRSAEERDRLIERLTNDQRLYRLAEREYAFGSGLLDMLQQVTAYESEAAMLEALDANKNSSIELTELPADWRELPRSGGKLPAETYTPGELLTEAASGAREVRDKYLLRMAQSLEVLQASIRVEEIALVPFSLDGTMRFPEMEEVTALGLEYRHDLMNARAAVMDARREVEIQANRLLAGLDVNFRGTQGLNPNSRGNTNHSAGLQFTTPLDQVLERNSYRAAQISFQRARRAYMEQEDRVKQSIRLSWRQIQVQEYRIEVNRTTVRNAALTYDSASLQATGAQQTNALNLTQALDSVLSAQNSLVADWVTYETNRLNIFRDMGIMDIDPRGVWTDPFYLQIDQPMVEEGVAPPATPDVVLPTPAQQEPAPEPQI